MLSLLNARERFLLGEVIWLEVLLGTVPVFLPPSPPLGLANPAAPVISDSDSQDLLVLLYGDVRGIGRARRIFVSHGLFVMPAQTDDT